MYPTGVKLNNESFAKLTQLYKTAYAEIGSQIEGASSFGVANRRAILRQIEDILKGFGEDVNGLIDKQITDYYKLGADQAIDQLKHVDAPIQVGQRFNQIHQEAIAALVDDTQIAFGESIQGVNRSAVNMLGKGVREQITERIAVGKVSGSTLKTIKNNVVGQFKTQGLDSIVDKAGRSWSLDRYAEMLIRTKTVEARNRGMVNRMAENGYDLVQVSNHGADDACGDWEGEILSITGDTPGYSTVADAEAGGLFHPNCKHAINALAPGLAEKTQAYNPDEQTLFGPGESIQSD